jgi:hypothetical protein
MLSLLGFYFWKLRLLVPSGKILEVSGLRLNNYTQGGCYVFWTNRTRIQWGCINQGSRCDVGVCLQMHWKYESMKGRHACHTFFKAN